VTDLPAKELGGKNRFGRRPVDLMQSFALRVLNKSEHLMLLRIEIELRQKPGYHNGDLIVTKEQFVDFGVRPDSIAPGIRALEALGIIVCYHGDTSRQPNRFFLNYDCGTQGDCSVPTNGWDRFWDLEDAEEAARQARKAKDPKRVMATKRGQSLATKRGHVIDLKTWSPTESKFETLFRDRPSDDLKKKDENREEKESG
jgi:hypothetical protein